MNDEYLQDKVDHLMDTDMQRQIRELRPLPVGVVIWQRVDDGVEDLREDFRTMREIGITALKQLALSGDEDITREAVELAALEEGVIPWFYGMGGWHPITPELLEELDIDPDLSVPEIQRHPAMLEYQTEYLKDRARRLPDKPPLPPGVKMGEPPRGVGAIRDDMKERFAEWLAEQYGTLENALQVYHLSPGVLGDRPRPETLLDLAEMSTVSKVGDLGNQRWVSFRQKRDILRFNADMMCEGIRRVAELSAEWDPNEPIRTGSHHSLSNQAANSWDFELQARSVAEAGGFYSSFHPTHHLTEVDGELDRPCYMTSRIVADSAKGIWAGMWESVGGPQSYSGHYSHTWDGRSQERVMLSYLAAGLKGIGIWCWNPRDKGWEIGEYSLLDLTGKVTERAETAGAISRACDKWRFELWEAHDQPQVGVLYSWENDAAFARLSYGGYPVERLQEYPHHPAWARIGAMRALINNHVPFEIITERNLKEGLVARYPAIYVPHTICLEDEVVAILRDYVEAGGRVVADAPTLLVRADDGTLFDTREGTDFERIFGVENAAQQSTFNYPLTFLGQPLTGFWNEVNVTGAEVKGRFHEGHPAWLENRLGDGSAAFIAYEASRMCHEPGNAKQERFIAQLLLNGEAPLYSVDAPIPAYRRVAPQADHYFVINDRLEEVDLNLSCRVRSYESGEDCVTGETVQVSGNTVHLHLEPRQGRWIRLQTE